MNFTQSIRHCLRHYGDFHGRARRSEFWWFFLFVQAVTLALVLLGGVVLAIGLVLAGSTSEAGRPSAGAALIVLGVIVITLAVIFGVATLVPSLAVGCRRLHDKGISGWLQLLNLITFGSIALWVLWALEGEPHENEYGAVP